MRSVHLHFGVTISCNSKPAVRTTNPDTKHNEKHSFCDFLIKQRLCVAKLFPLCNQACCTPAAAVMSSNYIGTPAMPYFLIQRSYLRE